LDTLVFKEISFGSQKLLEEIFLIYKEAFRLNEQQPISVLHNRLEQDKEVLFAAIQNDEVTGFGFLFDLLGSDFLLLDYLAVKENHRGKQIGVALFSHLKNYAILQKKHLLMEVDDPEFGDDKIQRLKRISFYQKNGALWLKDIKYILPALDHTLPTQQILMVVPKDAKNEFSGNEICELVKLLYSELYGIAESDETLQKIRATIDQKVQITPYL